MSNGLIKPPAIFRHFIKKKNPVADVMGDVYITASVFAQK